MLLPIPSITTHTKGSNGWADKLAEVVALRVPRVALFLTGVKPTEREALFAALENARKAFSFTIPFVHAVASMREREYRYLAAEFGTERFNLHPTWEYPLESPLSTEIREAIFIENSSISTPLLESDLDGFAGLCLDLSHLEDARRSAPSHYESVIELTQRFPVGANHVSAVGSEAADQIEGFAVYSKHVAASFAEFHYLKQLPRRAFSNLAALELENRIVEQLEIIEALRDPFAGGADCADSSPHPLG